MDMTDKDFDNVARMYVYLITDVRDLWRTSIDFLFSSLKQSPRETLLLISNYDPQDYFQNNVKLILLEVLANRYKFEFINIDNSTFLEKVQRDKSITGNKNKYYDYLNMKSRM